MPELPEVENFRIFLDQTALDHRIVDLEVVDQRIIKKSVEAFRLSLLKQMLTKSHRIGKYLFVESSGLDILVLHFGLTGNLEYFKDEEDRPKYAQVLFQLDNGFTLAYTSRRKFGWLDLTQDIEAFRQARRLGKDATEVTFEEFYLPLKKSKAPIKPKLLDQKHFAGIGNWIADEILYQSQIHPETTIDRLEEKDFRVMFDKMKHVLAVALANKAVFDEFPDYFLIHNRNEKGTCHHTGVDIVRIEVGGRGTFISPDWQKRRT